MGCANWRRRKKEAGMSDDLFAGGVWGIVPGVSRRRCNEGSDQGRIVGIQSSLACVSAGRAAFSLSGGELLRTLRKESHLCRFARLERTARCRQREFEYGVCRSGLPFLCAGQYAGGPAFRRRQLRIEG